MYRFKYYMYVLIYDDEKIQRQNQTRCMNYVTQQYLSILLQTTQMSVLHI